MTHHPCCAIVLFAHRPDLIASGVKRCTCKAIKDSQSQTGALAP